MQVRFKVDVGRTTDLITLGSTGERLLAQWKISRSDEDWEEFTSWVMCDILEALSVEVEDVMEY